MDFNDNAIQTINREVFGPLRDLFLQSDGLDEPYQIDLVVTKNNSKMHFENLDYLEYAEQLLQSKDVETFNQLSDIKKLSSQLKDSIRKLQTLVEDTIIIKMQQHYPHLEKSQDYTINQNSYSIDKLANIVWRNYMVAEMNSAMFYAAQSGNGWAFCETVPKSGYDSFRVDNDLIKSDQKTDVDEEKNLEILKSIINKEDIRTSIASMKEEKDALSYNVKEFRDKIKNLYNKINLNL